jgi:hypothetical protein
MCDVTKCGATGGRLVCRSESYAAYRSCSRGRSFVVRGS